MKTQWAKTSSTRTEDNNNAVVFYGEDIVEQKNKGAYYTDERFETIETNCWRELENDFQS